MDIVYSENNVPIRMTDERWRHITTAHPEMAEHYQSILETVKQPDDIYEGDRNERIALRKIDKTHHIVVVYKEINEDDGFIITAFMTSKPETFQRRDPQ
jgi:hypothetical protein